MRQHLWGPGSGILFAVLFVVGLFLFNLPVGGEGEPDATIQSFYADAGNRTQVIVAVYLWAVAGLCFLVFLADLYTTVRAAEAAPGRLSVVVLVAGSVFVALLFGAGAALGALASGMSLGREPTTLGDTGVARFMAHLGYGLILLYGALAAAALVTAVSLVARTTAVVPPWLMWGGFVVAVVLLFGIIFLPMLALPVWVATVSIVRMLRREPAATLVPPRERA